MLHWCTCRTLREACHLEKITPEFRRFWGYKASILGGGTIFGHGVFFNRIARRIAFDNVPYTVYCSGARDPGRKLTPAESRRLKRFCAHSTGIGVRGVNSLNWLADHGISTAEIIGDAALSFVPEATPELSGDFKVGVCLRFMRGGLRREEQTGTNVGNITLFADLCDKIVDRYDASLFFFNFGRNRFDDDGLAIREVLSLMKNRTGAAHARVFGFRENKDPVAAFSRLSRLDFTISQRLHPALVSWISGVPALSLEYQFNKAADTFSPLGLSQAVLNISRSDYGCILQTMERLLSDKPQLILKVNKQVGIFKHRQIDFMQHFLRDLHYRNTR